MDAEQLRKFLLDDSINSDTDDDDASLDSESTENEFEADDEFDGLTSESDEEEDEANAPEASSSKRLKLSVIKGRNGYAWRKDAPDPRGRRGSKVVTHLPTVRGEARNATTPAEIFKTFIDPEIIKEIVKWTNVEIVNKRPQPPAKFQSYEKILTEEELYAYIGLLFMQGVHGLAKMSRKELWSTKFGSDFYRAVMPERRFSHLSARLRFDDKTTRIDRAETDKFAAFRKVWDIFENNCTRNYSPHQYTTIDEQLVGFRGRCPFRIYIKSKPDRYGVKIIMLNDARTYYMLRAIPYVGKVTTTDNETVPQYYVRSLAEPIMNTQRVITMDNWFSSSALFDKLKSSEFGLNGVGTLRKSQRDIPHRFLTKKEVGTSEFLFDNKKTMVCYCPKKDKNVILLSTIHHDKAINNVTNKPEIVMFYNDTKSGTDKFDQICKAYTVARKTRRWPMRMFYAVLDHSGVNSYILYSLKEETDKVARRVFLKELAFQLVENHLKSRLANPRMRESVRRIIRPILGIAPVTPEAPPGGHPTCISRTRCGLCDRSQDRKTTMACHKCGRPICNCHRALCCVECCPAAEVEDEELED